MATTIGQAAEDLVILTEKEKSSGLFLKLLQGWLQVQGYGGLVRAPR